MKKLLIAALCVLGFVSAAHADDDRVIDVSRLPQKAREFITNYFPNEKVALAKEERDFFERKYEVVFADGAKAEFSKDGEWKEVDCRYSAVPAAIVPPRIASYIGENYPGRSVVKIERDRREYEVGLDKGLELTFDMQFNLIDVDN